MNIELYKSYRRVVEGRDLLDSPLFVYYLIVLSQIKYNKMYFILTL